MLLSNVYKRFFSVLTIITCLLVYTSAIAKDNNLFDAALNGNLSQVKKLLVKKKIKVNAKNGEGDTALIIASEQGYVDVVKALLAANADVNVKPEDGRTALFMASQYGHAEVVQALLAAKADINVNANNGFTPLMIASEGSHIDIVKILKAAGAKEDDLIRSLNVHLLVGRVLTVT